MSLGGVPIFRGQVARLEARVRIRPRLLGVPLGEDQGGGGVGVIGHRGPLRHPEHPFGVRGEVVVAAAPFRKFAEAKAGAHQYLRSFSPLPPGHVHQTEVAEDHGYRAFGSHGGRGGGGLTDDRAAAGFQFPPRTKREKEKTLWGAGRGGGARRKQPRRWPPGGPIGIRWEPDAEKTKEKEEKGQGWRGGGGALCQRN